MRAQGRACMRLVPPFPLQVLAVGLKGRMYFQIFHLSLITLFAVQIMEWGYSVCLFGTLPGYYFDQNSQNNRQQ